MLYHLIIFANTAGQKWFHCHNVTQAFLLMCDYLYCIKDVNMILLNVSVQVCQR